MNLTEYKPSVYYYYLAEGFVILLGELNEVNNINIQIFVFIRIEPPSMITYFAFVI